MSRRLRLDRAMEALPEVSDLVQLREALLNASEMPESELWAGSRSYATVGRRVADPARLEAMVPELVDRMSRRVEAVLRHAARALGELEAGDPAAAAHSLIAAGEIEEAARRLDEAERYYRKSLELGRKPRDRRGEALSLLRLGRVARARGDLEEALRLYGEGHSVSDAARFRTGVLTGCQGLGNVYVDQGNWPAAREWYLHAMESVDDLATPEFVHLCNALSVVERRLGNLDESERWLERGEEAAPGVGDDSARRHLEHGRAKLHVAKGELEEAERVLRRMIEEEMDPRARITALISLAEPLMLRGRLRETESTLREAEAMARHYGSASLLAYIYEELGKLAETRKDPDGFLFFEQALELARHHRLARAQQGSIQRAYGLFEIGTGAVDAGVARLEIARGHFRAAGAEVEARQVEEEALQARLEITSDRGDSAAAREEKNGR